MRCTTTSPQHLQPGISLIATIWLVMFLSIVLVSTVTVIKAYSEDIITESQSFKAYQLAHTGLSYAAHPTIERDDPLLQFQDPEFDEGYSVEMKPEATRLNINYILTSRDNELLFSLFTGWGLADGETDALIAALTDWIDSDDLEILNGAEKDYYAALGHFDRPFNRKFEALDELSHVRGWSSLSQLKPDWKNFFTLYSAGPIDIHEAPADILVSAAEVDYSAATEFLDLIPGDDGIMGTEDDFRFSSVEEALTQLAAPLDRLDIISRRFTTEGSILRIESTGTSGTYQKKLSLVLDKQGTQPVLYDFKQRNLSLDSSSTNASPHPIP